MFNGVTPSVPITNITTEDIQKYLEENKRLILAIMENQNLGKFNECAQYRTQLQQNLTYLSNLADALNPPPAVPPQMPPPQSTTMQQLQHPHAAMYQQQAHPSFLHQQQQFIQAQMAMQMGAGMGNNQDGLGAGGAGNFQGKSVSGAGGATNFLGKSVSGYNNNGGEGDRRPQP